MFIIPTSPTVLLSAILELILSSQEVCVPRTSILDVAVANSKDTSSMSVHLEVDLEEHGADKKGNKLFVCPSPRDVYAHNMFDEMPVNEIGKPFDGSFSPEMASEMNEVKEMVQKLALQMNSLSSRQDRHKLQFSSQMGKIKDSWATKKNLDDGTYYITKKVKKGNGQINCTLTNENLDAIDVTRNETNSEAVPEGVSSAVEAAVEVAQGVKTGNTTTETGTGQYEPIGELKGAKTRELERVLETPNVLRKASSVSNSTNCISEPELIVKPSNSGDFFFCTMRVSIVLAVCVLMPTSLILHQ
uniref:Uncharacterized protein n=1 Tax=Nicotiana tabacum TaxID=4097 RepID=A0A1S4DMN8_TOBAC|nr:PREDICTED: uncharacterized protein LOC107831195 [Nicotiana tabacum]